MTDNTQRGITQSPYSVHMSSIPVTARVRPPSVINEQIRALMLRSAGRLTAAQRAEYEALVEEWATAVNTGEPEAA